MLTPFSIDEVRLMERKTLYQVRTKCGNDKTFYRFGFNGKEHDPEFKGKHNVQDYGFRMNDTRYGRFFTVDPLREKYPELSCYQFASNRPFDGIDLDGLEYVNAVNNANTDNTNVKIFVPNNVTVMEKGEYEMKKAVESTVKQPQQTIGVPDEEVRRNIAAQQANTLLSVAPGTSDVYDAKDAVENLKIGNIPAAASSAFFLLPWTDALKLLKPFVSDIKELIKGVGTFENSAELVIKTTSNTFGDAKKVANELVDLGDNPQNYVCLTGKGKNPFYGKVTGQMSADGKKYWRVDWDAK